MDGPHVGSRPPSLILDGHLEGQAVLDLDAPDDAVAHCVQLGQQLAHLCLEGEVCLGDFRSRPVLAAELHLAHHPRRRVEHRLTVADDQVTNLAEIEFLHQPYQAFPRRRKGRQRY